MSQNILSSISQLGLSSGLALETAALIPPGVWEGHSYSLPDPSFGDLHLLDIGPVSYLKQNFFLTSCQGVSKTAETLLFLIYSNN